MKFNPSIKNISKLSDAAATRSAVAVTVKHNL